MATLEEKLKRQINRLARAVEGYEAMTDPRERVSALRSITQRQKNIIALEGRVARKKLKAQSARAGRRAGSARGNGKDFYLSPKWRQLRYQVLARGERRCACCGGSPSTGSVLHVDHIKPRSTHPELALDPANLQILCADCNLGKMNFDDTDFR